MTDRERYDMTKMLARLCDIADHYSKDNNSILDMDGIGYGRGVASGIYIAVRTICDAYDIHDLRL